jgi:hypothetical protein
MKSEVELKAIGTYRLPEWKMAALRDVCDDAGIKLSQLIRVLLDLIIFDPENQFSQLVIQTCLHPEMQAAIRKIKKDYMKKQRSPRRPSVKGK